MQQTDEGTQELFPCNFPRGDQSSIVTDRQRDQYQKVVFGQNHQLRQTASLSRLGLGGSRTRSASLSPKMTSAQRRLRLCERRILDLLSASMVGRSPDLHPLAHEVIDRSIANYCTYKAKLDWLLAC